MKATYSVTGHFSDKRKRNLTDLGYRLFQRLGFWLWCSCTFSQTNTNGRFDAKQHKMINLENMFSTVLQNLIWKLVNLIIYLPSVPSKLPSGICTSRACEAHGYYPRSGGAWGGWWAWTTNRCQWSFSQHGFPASGELFNQNMQSSCLILRAWMSKTKVNFCFI